MSAPFIAIEGMDGTGSTTQTRLLVQRLGHCPTDPTRVCAATKAPYPPSPFESAIRALLKESDGAQNTLLELFIRDRDWHWRNQVSEMGYDGTWVVSDRWHYSTMVYQSLTTEQSVFAIESQLRTVAPHADLTVVLDMETTVAESRMAARERDAFEKDTSLQFKVRWKYRELAKERDDLVVVSGVGCADEVHQRVLGAVSARFPGA